MRFFPTLIGSFYSAKLYRAVRRERGHGFGYSFKLVALTCLIASIAAMVMMHRALLGPQDGRPPLFDDTARQIAAQMPVMTYHKSQLITQHPQATVIYLNLPMLGKDDFPLATIDTTGDTTYATMKTPLLITGREWVAQSSNKKEVHSFEELHLPANSPLIINRALAENMAERLITTVHNYSIAAAMLLGSLVWLCGTVVYYILRLCMLCALAAGAILIGKLTAKPITFETAMRLAAVSYTPVMALSIVLLFFAIPLTTLPLFLAGLATLTAAIAVSRDAPLADPL